MIAPREIVVKTEDCARLPPLPEEPRNLPPDDIIENDGDGHCSESFYVKPFASYTDEPYLVWAIGLSKLPNVEAVYVCEWLEDRWEGLWYETYARLDDGKVVETATLDSSKDRTWRRIKTERAAHEHMWKHWPLSEVARRMGYNTRASLVSPRMVQFDGGRAYPPDTAGFERTLYGFIPKLMLDELEACAAASSSSLDAWIDTQARAAGLERLIELGSQDRSGKDPRSVEIALSDEAYRLLQKAAVKVDSSMSHVVQSLVAAHCPVPEHP